MLLWMCNLELSRQPRNRFSVANLCTFTSCGCVLFQVTLSTPSAHLQFNSKGIINKSFLFSCLFFLKCPRFEKSPSSFYWFVSFVRSCRNRNGFRSRTLRNASSRTFRWAMKPGKWFLRWKQRKILGFDFTSLFTFDCAIWGNKKKEN